MGNMIIINVSVSNTFSSFADVITKTSGVNISHNASLEVCLHDAVVKDSYSSGIWQCITG